MRPKQFLPLALAGLIGSQISLLDTNQVLAQSIVFTDDVTPIATSSPGRKLTFVCNNNNIVALRIQKSGTATQDIRFIQFTQDGSNYFQTPYTPRNRCNAIAFRLNRQILVGNQFRNRIQLRKNTLNGETAICSQVGRSCQLLLTLKPQNANQAETVRQNMQKWLQIRQNS